MTPEGVGWVGGRAGIIQAIPDSQRERTNKRKKRGKKRQNKTKQDPKNKKNIIKTQWKKEVGDIICDSSCHRMELTTRMNLTHLAP